MLEYLLLILGFVFLVKGAQLLIEGASVLAKRWGVSNLVIGLTIVAFGTSAPEFIIGIISSVKGESAIVFGNVIGANITDILLVLGISIYFSNIKFRKDFVKKEFPFLIYSVVLLMILTSDILFNFSGDSYLSRFDGFLLLILFILFLFKLKSSFNKVKFREAFRFNDSGLAKSIAFVIFGPVALFFGGKLVIDSAITISQNLGLTPFVISSTLISIGTTLPELVTAIVGIVKKQKSIVVGEIVGSLIFNILFVLGVAAVIHPIKINPWFNGNLLFFSLVSLFLTWIIFNSKGEKISRFWGVLFVLIYLIYLLYNFVLF